MAKRKTSKKPAKKAPKKAIHAYDHKDKDRPNNPPVGLVTPETDVDQPRKTYAYDPHLDPQLVWAGKAEHTSFHVPTVSLHVHERIDPRTIIEAVRKRNANVAQASSLHETKAKTGRQDACATSAPLTYEQLPLFEMPEENPPLREAIQFYKHAHNWTNRLIAGDSLLVMNSLLEKEGLAGKVQMIYIDPPYGIRYGSNFQPFVNKRDVKDGKDDDLTQEPEMIRAFRDTWELGIHSYLTYLRDRLLLARELLHESGSCFVQISDENIHHVRELMDELFGVRQFGGLITIAKTAGASSVKLAGIADYLLWYAKDSERVKYRQVYTPKGEMNEGAGEYKYLLMPDGTTRMMRKEELANSSLIPEGAERFRPSATTSQRPPGSDPFAYGGRIFTPGKSQFWKTSIEGLTKLGQAQRLIPRGESISYLRKLDDFPVKPINNVWLDTRWGFDAQLKRYVVETNTKVISRCILMATDPGDLVLDPTCGSGTTAYVAEQWGRRWITCDTSRVAIALAKQRLMTALYDYYELAHPDEGVGSGFRYKTVPHITLKSIANNPEIKEGMTRAQIDAAIARYADQETLYDRPQIDKSKARVSGPFTVEAVPAPMVMSIAHVAQASSLQAGGEAGKDAYGTVAQASSLQEADRMSALRRPELLSGTHGRGYLPHWKDQGATYFVTFRLAGTLPKSVLDAYDAERDDIVHRAEKSGRPLSKSEEKRLGELYSERIEAYLDAGHGDCWLNRPEIAELVAKAIRHFEGERYRLHAWVIMPNHVHVVLTPGGNHTLSQILHSWKSYTANEANELLGRPGQPFWQRESYDHVVRDDEDFSRVCAYTQDNPVVAGLCENPEDWRYGSAHVAQASSLQAGEAGKDACGTVAQASSLQEAGAAGKDACATWTADTSVARSGRTLRQDEWRSELLKCGIRGKGGQTVRFSRVEPLPGTRWLHADAETDDDARHRVVVSFGPEHAPLEQRQVAEALEEANLLVPKPRIVAFAAFHFDPEAAKDIDETNWPGITLLKVQMNTDLLTDDLKKKRSSNESFWMIGQPDVEVRRYVAQASSLQETKADVGRQDACATASGATRYQVQIRGFDYYNPRTGAIESGDTARIAMWMLDTDYDGRSLYPRQVFFPMAGPKDGWARLAKNLKAEIDEERIEAYRGSVSLPFEPGEYNRIAVKIVDDRGIESLKIVELG